MSEIKEPILLNSTFIEKMDKQNQLLAIIASGVPITPDYIDSTFVGQLDGTNTSKIFWTWWPQSIVEGQTKYDRLCRFGKIMARACDGKKYTLRSYNSSVSSSSEMTPLDDLADKSAGQLCTESTTPIADWTDEDPMGGWYIRANALSLEDGTMDVLYVEGEDGFDLTGEIAPVYTFCLSLWVKEWSDGNYNYISYRSTYGDGYYPDAADVDFNNQKRPITWHATFSGKLNSKGGLTSGVGGKPCNLTSAQSGLTAARKTSANEGLWSDCDTRWLLRMWQLRHFNLENSSICEGCLNYNYQYKVAIAEENVSRVLLTISQADNLLVGSTVSIGDIGENTNLDRGQSYMRNIVEAAVIGSISEVSIDSVTYKSINLILSTPITTTATTYISTWPWISGNTENIPNHKDGCTYSLTSGKTPIRIMGVEVLDGSYNIGLDPLYNVTAGSDSTHYNYEVYECRDSRNLSSNITSNYISTNIGMTDIQQGWNWVTDFVTTKLGILFPEKIGASSSTRYKSAFYGTGSSGVRCPWRFGYLGDGGNGGLACESGNSSPSSAGWFGRPRLSGAGKMRGEWQANA
jgi:hypothetical protein